MHDLSFDSHQQAADLTIACLGWTEVKDVSDEGRMAISIFPRVLWFSPKDAGL